MTTVLVSGVVNLETSVLVERFPLDSHPVRYVPHRVRTGVSGVAGNVARALAALGDEVRLCGLVGRDLAGRLAVERLREDGVGVEGVLPALAETPQSVVLTDAAGKRQVLTDLKDLQDASYPEPPFARQLDGAGVALLTNVNLNRPLLAVARERGVPIATDVQTLQQLQGGYDAQFLESATVLFLSHELLPAPPRDVLATLLAEHAQVEVAVVGLGARGALLGTRGGIEHLPAVTPRPVVSTAGAGDALFACFVHGWVAGQAPREALTAATWFAGHAIGEAGSGTGFLSAADLRHVQAARSDSGRPQRPSGERR